MKKALKVISYSTLLRFLSGLSLNKLYKVDTLYRKTNFESNNTLLILTNLVEYITYVLFIFIIFPITTDVDKNESLLIFKVSAILFIIFDIIIAFSLILFPHLRNSILNLVKYFNGFYIILAALSLLQYYKIKNVDL